MGQKDFEIEIKYPLTKAIFDKVSKKVAKLARFEGETHQVDRYFNSPHRNFLKPRHPCEYLRIRQKNAGGKITYKYVYLDKHGNKTHADEYETEINNPKALIKILEVLNFKEIMVIDKKRKKYLYQNKLEILLDKVKGLGYFIEIEAKAGFDNVKKAKEEILKLSKQIGIEDRKVDNQGYVLLMMKKMGRR